MGLDILRILGLPKIWVGKQPQRHEIGLLGFYTLQLCRGLFLFLGKVRDPPCSKLEVQFHFFEFMLGTKHFLESPLSYGLFIIQFGSVQLELVRQGYSVTMQVRLTAEISQFHNPSFFVALVACSLR